MSQAKDNILLVTMKTLLQVTTRQDVESERVKPFISGWCTQTVQMINMRDVKHCAIRVVVRTLL